MLVCLGLMLLSGPMMAWTGGIPVSVFGAFDIPPLLPENAAAFLLLHYVHTWSAGALATLITVHILGVMKHVIVDRDGVLDRIMVPPKRTISHALVASEDRNGDRDQ
jgi:cytochrome b561